jgi:predicted nucleic acid-binding protein
MQRVFIDCDVFLDLFLKRTPFLEEAKELFTLIELKKIKGFTSGLVFSNIFFILSQALNKKEALENLRKLNIFINVSEVKQSTIDKALASKFSDFEDAIQNYSAVETGVDYLLTRNIRDFKHSKLTVLSPKEYLSIRNS